MKVFFLLLHIMPYTNPFGLLSVGDSDDAPAVANGAEEETVCDHSGACSCAPPITGDSSDGAAGGVDGAAGGVDEEGQWQEIPRREERTEDNAPAEDVHDEEIATLLDQTEKFFSRCKTNLETVEKERPGYIEECQKVSATSLLFYQQLLLAMAMFCNARDRVTEGKNTKYKRDIKYEESVFILHVFSDAHVFPFWNETSKKPLSFILACLFMFNELNNIQSEAAKLYSLCHPRMPSRGRDLSSDDKKYFDFVFGKPAEGEWYANMRTTFSRLNTLNSLFVLLKIICHTASRIIRAYKSDDDIKFTIGTLNLDIKEEPYMDKTFWNINMTNPRAKFEWEFINFIKGMTLSTRETAPVTKTQTKMIKCNQHLDLLTLMFPWLHYFRSFTSTLPELLTNINRSNSERYSFFAALRNRKNPHSVDVALPAHNTAFMIPIAGTNAEGSIDQIIGVVCTDRAAPARVPALLPPAPVSNPWGVEQPTPLALSVQQFFEQFKIDPNMFACANRDHLEKIVTADVTDTDHMDTLFGLIKNAMPCEVGKAEEIEDPFGTIIKLGLCAMMARASAMPSVQSVPPAQARQHPSAAASAVASAPSAAVAAAFPTPSESRYRQPPPSAPSAASPANSAVKPQSQRQARRAGRKVNFDATGWYSPASNVQPPGQRQFLPQQHVLPQQHSQLARFADELAGDATDGAGFADELTALMNAHCHGLNQ